MKKHVLKKELLEDCRNFLKEELENNFNDKKYYLKTLEIRGSDKKWLKSMLFKSMKRENRLRYLLYIIEINIEAYEEVELEKKIQEQLSVF